MDSFRNGEGGSWMVTLTISSTNEVINSCKNYQDAANRAMNLASQSPDQQVTIYKAIERFQTDITPVKRTKVKI